jgi:hypothetical protein
MNKHARDSLTLTFGVIFLSAVTWWFLVLLVDVAFVSIAWFATGMLITLGVLGVLAAVRSELRHR